MQEGSKDERLGGCTLREFNKNRLISYNKGNCKIDNLSSLDFRSVLLIVILFIIMNIIFFFLSCPVSFRKLYGMRGVQFKHIYMSQVVIRLL